MAPITGAELRRKWAEAYAAQSLSDFQVYLGFSAETEECHRLHYLQMACEKIAKAYRLRDTLTPLEEGMRSHVGFSLFIENLLASPQIKQRYQSQVAKLRLIRGRARPLARELKNWPPPLIENNHPSIQSIPGLMEEGLSCLAATAALT